MILSVEDLTVGFDTRFGGFDAVRGVGLALETGRTLGLVGESGSGKSVTALALMRLLPDNARLTGGRIVFDGRDLAGLSEREMRLVRGRDIAMVFQGPMASLNPLLTIGRQITEPLRLHLGLGRSAARDRARELLELVRIPAAERILESYPHELSGGMRQRVMIAIALTCGPRLLIADEPTTALDVTTQARILALLGDLRRRLDMAVLLITHDLGVVSDVADDVAVMYAGRIVEQAPVATLFARPAHPYTRGLLRSMPSLDEPDPDVLPAIEGNVASPFDMPSGCAFHPRCPWVADDCMRVEPPLVALGPGHQSACLRHDAVAA